jgi:hypothetical protein
VNNDLALLMEENLALVWSERDASDRMKSIQAIYTADSTLYHIGHHTINKSVNDILANMPAVFNFFKLKPVVVNNNFR